MNPRIYGDWLRMDGMLEEQDEATVEEAKHLVKQQVEDGIREAGLDPDNFHGEFIIRQEYVNGAPDASDHDVFDSPIWADSRPRITIAYKATEKTS